jgi:hypothetical protein
MTRKLASSVRLEAKRPGPGGRLPGGDHPAVQVPHGGRPRGRGVRAHRRQPHRLLRRPLLLRVQCVLPRAGLPEASHRPRAARLPREDRRRHGLGLQQEDLLLQRHHVLEVGISASSGFSFVLGPINRHCTSLSVSLSVCLCARMCRRAIKSHWIIEQMLFFIILPLACQYKLSKPLFLNPIYHQYLLSFIGSMKV